MALFNQRVGERSSPTASLEALQEINTICNDIALSQPALEALFELPNLASQFNQTNSAPSIAMLEFVTQQKYQTLGMEDFSVATEGILSSVGSGIKKAYDWIVKKLGELRDWFMSFFSKKPVEQIEKKITDTIKEVDSHIAKVTNDPVSDRALDYKGLMRSATKEQLRTLRVGLVKLQEASKQMKTLDAKRMELNKSLGDFEAVVNAIPEEDKDGHMAEVLPRLRNTIRMYTELSKMYARLIHSFDNALIVLKTRSFNSNDPIGFVDHYTKILVKAIALISSASHVLMHPEFDRNGTYTFTPPERIDEYLKKFSEIYADIDGIPTEMSSRHG